jgi:hypothetical protein
MELFGTPAGLSPRDRSGFRFQRCLHDSILCTLVCCARQLQNTGILPRTFRSWMHSGRNRKSVVMAAYENHRERLCDSCCTVLESSRTASPISAQKVDHLIFVKLAGYYSFELLTEEFGCK